MKRVTTTVAGVKLADGTEPPRGHTVTVTDAEADRLAELGYVAIEEGSAGGVDMTEVEAVVQAAVDAVATIPPGGEPSQVLVKASATDRDVTWADLAHSSGRLRIWESGDLVYTYNFDAGTTTGGYSIGGGWGGTPVEAVLAGSVPAGGPAYTKFAHFIYTDGGAPTLTLDPAQVPALAGVSLVHAKFWWRTAVAITFTQGGVQQARLATADTWAHAEVALTGSGSLVWQGDRYSDSWLSGIELYAPSADPFMLNDLATHDGAIWKSMLDNNPNEPGVDATWQVIVGG